MAEPALDPVDVLALSPAERDERGVSTDDVRDALVDVIEHGSRDEKRLDGCTLPAIDLDYRTLDGAENHPVVFRDCSFEGFSAEHADVKLPVTFEDCTVGGLSLDGARFEYDAAFRDTGFTGAVEAFEARFDRDADFSGATFDAPVTVDEATFDDVRFVDATFRDEASFRAAEFHGKSNELDDNADFSGATFEAGASFRQADAEFVTFDGAAFHGLAAFQEARFRGDADFAGVAFHDEADFDEVDFEQDASFDAATFEADAVFRGAEFEGGARSLQDDARFADADFRGDADFRDAQFRSVNFERAAFASRATFEEVRFDGDADFPSAAFDGEADFDEARFREDADFSNAAFAAPAVFRGAEFEGDANHLEDNATFQAARFEDDADFDNAVFTTANFRETAFAATVDFSAAEFAEHVAFAAEPLGDDVQVDFTDAVLKEGVVAQPAESWMHYDLTRASLGDVALEASHADDEHHLLDYFRFSDTEFSEFDGYEFDFAAHTAYFDRNDWTLHTVAGDDTDQPHETVETTYLKAKIAASAAGNMKAAGEFRVKRQRAARRKHFAITRDRDADAATRFRSASRAAENYFLDVTCGHGMRLFRIIAVFLVVPLLPALLYTFGGSAFRTSAGQLSSLRELATPAGQAVLYENLHFSYITFLTIGYGGIGPKGALARLLAGLEVYLSVILGGLVLYALIKRSEL